MRSENLGLETGEFGLGLTVGLTCNLKTAQWMAPSQFIISRPLVVLTGTRRAWATHPSDLRGSA